MTDIDQIMDRAVDRFAHETPRRSNGHAGPACVPGRAVARARATDRCRGAAAIPA